MVIGHTGVSGVQQVRFEKCKNKKKKKASPQLLPKALHSHLRLLGFLVVYTVI